MMLYRYVMNDAILYRYVIDDAMLYRYVIFICVCCRQVCGENLIYRHILKKHLRQVHGINPQNLDDRYVFTVYMYL